MVCSLSIRRVIAVPLGLLGVVLAALAFAGSPARASGTQVLRLAARPHMVLRFTTSHLRAHPGRITIVMHNPSNAGMSHGIAVDGHGVDRDGPIVKPGRNSVLTVVLRRRGSYTFYCPVPGHRQAGMRGTLTLS